jgi:hypothetical protein
MRWLRTGRHPLAAEDPWQGCHGLSSLRDERKAEALTSPRTSGGQTARAATLRRHFLGAGEQSPWSFLIGRPANRRRSYPNSIYFLPHQNEALVGQWDRLGQRIAVRPHGRMERLVGPFILRGELVPATAPRSIREPRPTSPERFGVYRCRVSRARAGCHREWW